MCPKTFISNCMNGKHLFRHGFILLLQSFKLSLFLPPAVSVYTVLETAPSWVSIKFLESQNISVVFVNEVPALPHPTQVQR